MTVSEDIVAGQHDDELDIISNAIRIRKETKNSLTDVIARAQLQVGDHVLLNTPTLRPKYLNRATGTITDLTSRKTAGVRLDEAYAEMARGAVWNIPYHCIEKLQS